MKRTGAEKGGRRRKRALAAVGVIGVSLIAAACGPQVRGSGGGGCNAPGGPPDAVTQTVFNATNASRGGLGSLSWNSQLYCLAREWSTHLGSTGGFYHRDLQPVLNSGAYSGYRTLGENILRGPASMDGNQMHQSWMASSSHAANIMSRSFSSMAIALYYTGGGMVYATENFGG